jgi:LCP family protein required for cell wall assembly
MSQLDYPGNQTETALENNLAARRQKRKARKKRRFLFLAALSAAILLLLGGFLYAYLNSPPEPGPPPENASTEGTDDTPPRLAGDYKEGFYTFLLVGTDMDDYHTDTIMVVALDTVAQKVHLVSVPRDTQIDVPRNPKKINSAFGLGGIKQLKKELKTIIGFVPHYYIVVNLEAFKKVVNAAGGVRFDVPQDMNYDDPTQNLHIHLKKGPQDLDGKKALQLVHRSRSNKFEQKKPILFIGLKNGSFVHLKIPVFPDQPAFPFFLPRAFIFTAEAGQYCIEMVCLPQDMVSQQRDND